MTDAPKKKQGFAAHPECINRKGRIGKGQTIAELTRAFLAEQVELTGADGRTLKAAREMFLRKGLFSMAMSSPDHGARIRATEALMDRAYGKSVQAIDGDLTGELTLRILRESV